MPTIITPKLLRSWPLPLPGEEGDKEERGRVLVVGGSRDMPGAVILGWTAALRAGAGKLQVATVKSISAIVGASIPEARVFSLTETKTGAISSSCVNQLAIRAQETHSILIGPGMINDRSVVQLLRNLVPKLPGVSLILDAAALSCLARTPRLLVQLSGNVVMTPHAGEMAKITSQEKSDITGEPLQNAIAAAREFHSVVALKGSVTYIAAPDGTAYINKSGNVGLATSGSGDALAGIISGLVARGAEPLRAAVWGVYLHGCAGDRLFKKMGPVGFLARELLAEVPSLMLELGRK